MQPIFVLGVGAQKAGTSWLHKQIHKSSQVDMGFAKEYHVWDVVYQNRTSWEPQPSPETRSDDADLNKRMRSEPGVYEGYFKALIRDDVFCTGDITPAYAGLSVANLEAIKSRLERAGFRVKVIFLMRDPAERVWSAMRMLFRLGGKVRGAKSERDLLTNFEAYFQRPKVEMRTRYDMTIGNLRAVFNSDDLFLGVYENMFQQVFSDDLHAFLGVAPGPVDFKERVNSYTSSPLPNAQYAQCREYYREVYEFCAEHCPSTKHLWCRD